MKTLLSQGMRFLGGMILLVVAASCERTTTAPIAPEATTTAVSVRWQPDSADVQLLARGIALALRAPAIRQQLLEDLRDSPFEAHAIELGSYLRGVRGRALLDSATSALGVNRGQLASAAGPANTNGLELSMTRYGDRRNWRGTDDVAVFGIAEQPSTYIRRNAGEAALNGTAFTTQGGQVAVNLLGPGPTPYLLISPAQRDFGPDPESVRVRAGKKPGVTIGAPDEQQIRTFLVVCDTNCDGGGGGGTLGAGYVTLPSGQAYSDCVHYVSYEVVNATCRAELAQAFRPRVIFNSDEPCANRAPYWAARPDGTSIAIFYALSYSNDCANRTGLSDHHYGDSEFIIVRVVEDPAHPGHWSLGNVTLSAHYGVMGGDGTWTGSPPAIEFRPYENLTRPKVYVSYGKHANYRDIGSCGRGAWGFDDCGRMVDAGVELGILSGGARDLGFRQAQTQNCVANSFGWNTGYQECYWSYAILSIFTGWNGMNPGATSYTQLFADFGY